ncbi:MAG TPA: hypothetical protein VGY30_11075 [Solirubrobacteraceae bacterium]|jgi:hypothetical protein|nr:hypothetical protein [Solirubrobacteraceae bacterium]
MIVAMLLRRRRSGDQHQSGSRHAAEQLRRQNRMTTAWANRNAPAPPLSSRSGELPATKGAVVAATDSTADARQPDDDQAADDRLRRLIKVGDLDDPTVSNRERDTNDDHVHDKDRHPEDPPSAFRDTAREVCDPEQIRIGLADTGKASQAIDPETFEPLLDEVVDGIYRTRAGAVIGPAQLAVGERLKVSESTEIESQQITRERGADGNKADRLEQNEAPRLEKEIAAQQAEISQKEEERRGAKSTLDEQRAKGYPAGWRPGDFMHWVGLPPWLAFMLMLIALVINTVLLQRPMSNVVVNISEVESYLVAGGLSVTFEVASATAGYVLASLRLPGRLGGSVFIVLFSLVMLKLVGGLDALRASKPSGVETLTAATLASCFVAGLTGYAIATWRDFQHHRDLVLAVGTDLRDALGLHEIAEKNLGAAKDRLGELKQALIGLYAEIERLRDSAARADAAALDREALGAKAAVEADAIRAVATSHVLQEKAAHLQWGKGMALLAYFKARREKLRPDADIQLPTDDPGSKRTSEMRLTSLQKLAIAALAAGAIGGSILGPLALAVGAVIAAILLLPFGDIGGRRGRRKPPPETELHETPSIDGQADPDNPFYKSQPDHMVAKYRGGEAPPGQHQ